MIQTVQVVGFLTIPESVLRHRFVREALGGAHIMAENYEAGDSAEQVVGTANTGAVELYSWMANVKPHADKTGYVYLAALNESCSLIQVKHGDEIDMVGLSQGTVVRLNDHFEHSTKDDVNRVCLFLGSFAEPCDDEAMLLFKGALDRLSSGAYYDAPRVRDGFRAYMDDECLVPNDLYSACTSMLLDDAKKNGIHYETCAMCDKPAVILDHHFPYSLDSRCRSHSTLSESIYAA